MSSEAAVRLVILAILGLFLVSVLHRAEHYFWKLKLLIAVGLAYFLGVWAAVQLGHSGGFEPLLWGLVAAFVADRMIPGRSRQPRASVRRKVVARWEAETGKKFNSRFYEVDHIIPFAKGGNNTEDNLRVVRKKQNRSKGAKSPWWDLLGR